MKPSPGASTVRRPLNSTSVRVGPRPRRFSEPLPWKPCDAVEYWLESPSVAPTEGSCLMNSSGEETPCLLRSSAVNTSTGIAASSRVPRMKLPVTMISLSTASVSAAAWGAACANTGLPITAIVENKATAAQLLRRHITPINLLPKMAIAQPWLQQWSGPGRDTWRVFNLCLSPSRGGKQRQKLSAQQQCLCCNSPKDCFSPHRCH